jgi:hypothetical protein
MEVHLLADGTIRLEDADNFRAFKLVIDLPRSEIERARKALEAVALLPDAQTAWVSEQALRRLPGHHEDHDWQHRLGQMIEKAKPHGWIDEVNQAIKAHIDWTE